MASPSLVEAILTFKITSRYNILTSKKRVKLSRIVEQAGKIIGLPQIQFSHLYERPVIKNAILIT